MKKISVLTVMLTLLLTGSAILPGAATASASRTKTAQSADVLLSMMPDADGIVAVNVTQLNQQIQNILGSKPETAAELQKQFDKILAETGLDVRSINSLVLGVSLGSDRKSPDPLILISGIFDQEQVLAKLGRKSGRKWKAKNYNGQKVYTEVSKNKKRPAKPEKASSVTFFDTQTIAFGSLASVRKSIDVRTGVQTAVLQNPTLMSAFNQANIAGSIRFAFTVPEELRRRLAEANGGGAILKPLAAITQVVGTADLADSGLLANVSLITGSDSEASEVVNLINTGLALVRLALANNPNSAALLNILNGITHSQSGNVANLTVNVPADLIRSLFDQIKSKAPKA
ncbi:MAG TPA: hypothetical protein VNO14_02115 [Blastocatellia bacterium]|nr:hypothetical protein [Blastocatellia bacterium]